jgi:hypothetical protein
MLEYQFEISGATRLQEQEADGAATGGSKKDTANHLQKCPVAVEFGVPRMQLFRACRKALLIPALLNNL